MQKSSIKKVVIQQAVQSPATKHKLVKLQKEVKSTQKQPNCKKGAAHAKKTV